MTVGTKPAIDLDRARETGGAVPDLCVQGTTESGRGESILAIRLSEERICG